jgi:hypothetical protein
MLQVLPRAEQVAAAGEVVEEGGGQEEDSSPTRGFHHRTRPNRSQTRDRRRGDLDFGRDWDWAAWLRPLQHRDDAPPRTPSRRTSTKGRTDSARLWQDRRRIGEAGNRVPTRMIGIKALDSEAHATANNTATLACLQ